jgi:hypothetical protein
LPSLGSRPETPPIVIRLPSGPPLDVDRIRFDRRAVSLFGRRGEEPSIDTDGTALTISPGIVSRVAPGSEPRLPLASPLLRLEGDGAQIGFDTSFEMTAALGCKDAEPGRIEWRQLEGPPLAEVSVREGGRRFRARTLPRSHFFPDPLPPGIVAVSPRTQGRYVMKRRLLRRSSGRTPHRDGDVDRALDGARASRYHSGSCSAAPGGTSSIPRGGRARVEDGARAVFTPDVAGRWIPPTPRATGWACNR